MVTVVLPKPIAVTSNHDAGLPFEVGLLLLRAASATTVTMRVLADCADTTGSPVSLIPSTAAV
jgi:hypothetical protein